MPLKSRVDRQTDAVVLLLKSLTEAQLIDVLQAIGATLDVPTNVGPRHRGKPCTICGLIYPEHMKRWGDDHPYERPPTQEELDH